MSSLQKHYNLNSHFCCFYCKLRRLRYLKFTVNYISYLLKNFHPIACLSLFTGEMCLVQRKGCNSQTADLQEWFDLETTICSILTRWSPYTTRVASQWTVASFIAIISRRIIFLTSLSHLHLPTTTMYF